jgi:hypothetical protein
VTSFAREVVEAVDDTMTTAFLCDAVIVLWTLRVLDAWAEQYGHATPTPRRVSSVVLASAFQVPVPSTVPRGRARPFFGPTPDAARLAAAEAVFPELSEATRVWLGKRPDFDLRAGAR